MNNLPWPVPEKPLSVKECDALLTQKGTIFEMETVLINGLQKRVWKNAPPTFRFFLKDRLSTFADRVFLSSPTAEPAGFYAREHVTFGEVLSRATQLGAWLRDRGIGLGSRVAIGGLNCVEWVVVFVAIHLIGAVPVLLNSTMQLDAQIHCLELTEPELVLVDASLARVLGPAKAQLDATHKIGPVFCWSSVKHLGADVQAGVRELFPISPSAAAVRGVEDGSGLESLHPESDGLVMFTSGTTNMPKGVLSSQRACLTHVLSSSIMGARMAMRVGAPLDFALNLHNPPEAPPVMLLAVPLFHVTGILGWLARGMQMGVKVVFLRRWSVKDAVDIIVKEKVNAIGGVPAIATAVLQSPRLPKDHSIENVTYGGAPPAKRLADDIVERWPAAIPTHAYGLTETNGLHVGWSGPDYIANPESTGPSMPVDDIRIVDMDTKQPVGPGVIGTVQCRGPNIMTCYINNPKATAEAVDKDGWFESGDMAMMDTDGNLYIRDRAKDVIIRGGENIASAEVENAVWQDDRVAEVAAVAVPCERLGERVGVAVSLAPGTQATPQSIIAAAEGRLRYPARPVIVVVMDQLPRNANGKIVKSDVKKVVHAEWAKVGGGQAQAKL